MKGHLSTFFPISRGVRQGDPLSPYIFIISIELLSAAIKFDPDIKGVLLENSEYLITQYADDSALILGDDSKSLQKALHIIALFGQCSCLKTNFDKSQAVWIGAKRGFGEEIRSKENIAWNHQGKFKLLGIQYDLLNSDYYSCNFDAKLSSMQSLLSPWSFRNLSIIGKVTVIKSLAFPIIIQVLTVLPSPSIQILKKIQNTFFNFLWNSKVDKIKRDIMICDLDEGGLRVPDIFTYCKSLKLTWIKRAMDPANQSDWKKLLLDNIEFVGGDKFWHLTKTGLNQITKRTNFGKFWEEVVEIWRKLQEPFTTAPESILSQPLWFNSSIKIDGNPIFYQNWCNRDIFFINDLIDETGIFMNYHVFTRKYDLNISYISYAGILSSIPRDWKRIIKDYGKRVDAFTNKNID